MTAKKNKNISKNQIDTASEISGGVLGAVLASLIDGTSGLILSGASSPIFTRIFKSIGWEIKHRVLSQREIIRIDDAFTFAIKKILKNEEEGQTLRTDSFFESTKDNRPASEEILEGIILSTQREFEELKIKFLGFLYANICFRPDVSREHANQLIKVTSNLSFRQLCVLQLLNERNTENHKLNFKAPNFEKWEIADIDIIAEIRDLQQRGLLHIPTTYDGGDNSAPIKSEKITITKSGLFYCEMLSLNEIEKETLDRLNKKTVLKA